MLQCDEQIMAMRRPMPALMAEAKLRGRVDFDEAPLPNGAVGWIAYIGDMPGLACSTKLAALASALAAVSGRALP